MQHAVLCSMLNSVCLFVSPIICLMDVCKIGLCFVKFPFKLSQENPSEEDAAIVDKVLSMRLTKKEVRGLDLLNIFYLSHFRELFSSTHVLPFKDIPRPVHQCGGILRKIQELVSTLTYVSDTAEEYVK